MVHMGAPELRDQYIFKTSPYQSPEDEFVTSNSNITPEPLSITLTDPGSIKTSHCEKEL